MVATSIRNSMDGVNTLDGQKLEISDKLPSETGNGRHFEGKRGVQPERLELSTF
jgi:hypothetical protein